MVYATKEDPKDNGWTTYKSGVVVATFSWRRWHQTGSSGEERQ